MFLTALAFFKAVIVIIFKNIFYCFFFLYNFLFFLYYFIQNRKIFQKSGGISNYFYRKKY